MSVKEADSVEEDGYMNLGEFSGPLSYESHDILSTRSRERLQDSPVEDKDHASECQRKGYGNLDELMAPAPVENPHEIEIYQHFDLEEARSHEQQYEKRAGKELLE